MVRWLADPRPMGHDDSMDNNALRAKTDAACRQGPDAVFELFAEIMTQMERLSVRVAALEVENAALKARLGTDSHNSSKPPSSDGPGVKPRPKSLRVASGHPSGGQPGHPGHTLRLTANPDAVELHAPCACRACGRSLVGVAPQRVERRQVVDLPPIKVQVVGWNASSILEHQSPTVRCPDCG